MSPRRYLRRLTCATTTAALLLLGAPAVLGGPDRPGTAVPPGYGVPSSAGPLALASHRKEHPNRKLKRYRVRRGDTPSEIAVRYHAWTDELVRMNHGPRLYAGEVIRIPVVVKASRRCEEHRHHRTGFKDRGRDHAHHRPDRGGKKKHSLADRDKKHEKKKDKQKSNKPKRDRWRGEDASRATVRAVIVRTSKRVGVNPDLALAISWMESGWQQKRVSSAGALGAMQVMPGTGQWMSQMAGRKLHLRRLKDNVVAGTTLLEWLRSEARLKVAVAGYYQGLNGVRKHGMYRSTKAYVADVLALKKRLARGWDPS